MSTATQSGTRSPGRLVTAVVLAILGILAIVVGFIHVIEPAGSLPGFLGREPGSTGHRPLDMAGAFGVGVVLLALAAWTSSRSKADSDSSAGS